MNNTEYKITTFFRFNSFSYGGDCLVVQHTKYTNGRASGLGELELPITTNPEAAAAAYLAELQARP